MQVDPIGMASVSLGNPQSLNLYAYVGNDPVNFVDPLGLICYQIGNMEWWCDIGDSAEVGTGGGAGGGGSSDQSEAGIGDSGGGSGGGAGPAPEPLLQDPAPRNNPRCQDWVNQLLDYYYSSWTSSGAGIGMIKLAVTGEGGTNFNGEEFNKNMPGEPNGPLNGTAPNLNGFKLSLVNNNQRGNVYHHIMFMAGSTIVPGYLASPAGAALLVSDLRQASQGRLESQTELRDDAAGTAVGDVLNKYPKARNRDNAREEITNILCAGE